MSRRGRPRCRAGESVNPDRTLVRLIWAIAVLNAAHTVDHVIREIFIGRSTNNRSVLSWSSRASTW